MKVICGLGNPGETYAGTRHNAGFVAVASLAAKLDAEFGKSRFLSRSAEARRGEERLLLLKPKTYMNHSGRAVAAALNFFGLDARDLIVLHDDLDLPAGTLRIKARGGTAGHKGLVSIVQEIGTDEFLRIRIGIGRPAGGIDPADYVLARPNAAERQLLERAALRAAEAALLLLDQGPSATMNAFNRSLGGAEDIDKKILDQGAQP